MSRPARALLCWSLLVSVTKLWLVNQEEIIATSWDATVYAQMAADRIWFPEQFQQLGYRPGVALLAVACQAIGLPYRLGIELLWLLACGLYARAALSLTGSLAVACLMHPLLALHPWSVRYLHYFLSEAPAGALCLSTLALALLLGARARVRWSDPLLWLAGLSLALWDLQRVETLLLVPTWLAWVLVLVWRRVGWRARAAEGALLLLVPLAVLLASQGIIRAVNRATTGLGALSVMEAPGYHALMSALFRVDAEDASLHVPVTRGSLAAAIAVSPTLQQYEKALLDPSNPETCIGAGMCGRPGEFGPRVHTLILNSISTGLWKSDEWGKRDALMQRAADEIDAALRDGRLPSRLAWFPIDPNVGLWLPELPSATWFNLAAVFGNLEWWGETDDNLWQDDRWARGRTADRSVFDVAAGRRAALSRIKSVVIEGEAASTAGELTLVALEDEQGRVLGAASPLLAPKLPIPGQDGVEMRTRFTIDCDIGDAKTLRLSFWRDGERLCEAAPQPGGRAVPVGDGTETVLLHLWRLRKLDPDVDRQFLSRIKIPLADHFPIALAAAAALVFLLALCTGVSARGCAVIALACALAIALRVGFYDLLTATFAVREERYAKVVSPLVVPLCLAAAGLAGCTLARWRGARAPAEASAAP